MTDNLRESFRVGPEAELEVELSHEGRTAPCTLVNLSAGGAKLTTSLQFEAGAACTLRARIRSPRAGASREPWVEFLMEALQASSTPGGTACRLRNVTGPGSPDYERAAKLVFEAQRRILARGSGTSAASPMASDEDRRRDLRPNERARFSRSALRPDGGD